MIPSNATCVREDEPDRIYATRAEKEEALVDEMRRCHERGRPVLIGTLDVKESEQLAAALQAAGVPCAVLNAKNDAEEAEIIAEAGAYGAVTVSTQMAGRGVDIRLGGSDQADRDKVAELGGLYVIGSGRHDSRRVDDQLRGRAGRQGDPGGSVFFVSLEDELVTRHAADAVPPSPRMNADGLVTDDQVEFAVEHAQRVAEGVNHEIHRNTWRYNVVIEQQRKALAERRERLLTSEVAALMLMDRFPERTEEMDEDILSRGRALDRALPPGPALGRAPGAPVRGARGRAPAGAGPARPARRVPPQRGAGVQRADARDRGADGRDLRRDGVRRRVGAGQLAAGPAERDLDLPGARQPVRLRAGPADRFGGAPAGRRRSRLM